MRFITLLVGLVLASNAFAGSINLGTAGNYNAFIKTDFTASNSDTQGRAAIGGNLNVEPGHGSGDGQYDFGFKIKDFNMGEGPALVVGGDVNKSGSDYLNVYHGDLVYAGDVNHAAGVIDVIGANLVKVDKSPINFNDEFAYLNELSDELAKRTASGTTDTSTELTFIATTTPSDNVYVFDVSQEQMNGWQRQFRVSGVSDDATIVFNITNKNNVVSGGCPAGQADCITFQQSTIFINGKNEFDIVKEHDLNGRSPSQVIYNFPGATELNLVSGLYGTVLAPSADIKTTTGAVWGTVIGNSWQGGMQINHDPFRSTIPTTEPPSEVPEPSTIMLMLLGLAVLTIRRIKTKPQNVSII